MKGLAICSKGIEDITALEINELIKAKTSVKESCVIFETEKIEDFCLLCYKAQSVSRVLFLFDSFSIKKIEDIKNKIKAIKIDEWLGKNSSFKVSCLRIGEHDFSSMEVEAKTGEFIIDKIKKEKKYEPEVDLENPGIPFFVYIYNDGCYLGIDFSGFELSKRQYKIFPHPAALKATIAYSLVRIAGYKKDEIMLDTFCGSGTIAIEAALFAYEFPVNYYNKEKFAFLKFNQLKGIDFNKFFGKIDENARTEKKIRINGFDNALRHVEASKKNAKIAGIEKQINFSRVDIEWLETKIAEKTADKIVANPPQLSRNVNEKDIEKLYNEFFYQAEFVLTENGKIVLITNENSLELLKRAAEKYKFRIIEERIVMHGKEERVVAVFGR